MLGRVSREGGGDVLNGALHPDQIVAVVSSLLCDIDSVVRYEDQRQAWAEIFRHIASKAHLPVATYETFLTWRAEQCIRGGKEDAQLYIPHKTNAKGYFEVLAAWWQKLGLIPKGNAKRFAGLVNRFHWKRSERRRTRRAAEYRLGQNFPNWIPLENKIHSIVRPVLRTIIEDTESLNIRVHGRSHLRWHLRVPRTKTGRIKKNEYSDLVLARDWYRRVWKRGWAVIDGLFVLDWIEDNEGVKVATLVEQDRPKNFLVGVQRLDLSGGTAQMAGRPTLLTGSFCFEHK